jgi:hypothetical protein
MQQEAAQKLRRAEKETELLNKAANLANLTKAPLTEGEDGIQIMERTRKAARLKMRTHNSLSHIGTRSHRGLQQAKARSTVDSDDSDEDTKAEGGESGRDIGGGDDAGGKSLGGDQQDYDLSSEDDVDDPLEHNRHLWDAEDDIPRYIFTYAKVNMYRDIDE